MRRGKQKKGFTLLEILLVIAAIGILAAIVLIAINPNKQIEAARTAQRRSDINSIAKAVQQFIIDNGGSYPGVLQNIPIGGTIGLCISCSNGINLTSTLVPTYIAAIPIPPDVNGQYTVTKTANGVSTGYDSAGNTPAIIAGSNPSLDLNFARDKSLINPNTGLPIDFTRNSIGTYTGFDGNMKTAVANEPRFDHNPITGESLGLLIEEARTNRIRNNSMVGAVAGNPGTLPTNWSGGGPSAGGINRSVVGTGTENGIPYIDLRFVGTSTVNPNLSFSWGIDNYANMPGTNTTIYTFSSYVKLVAGTVPAGVSQLVVMYNANSIGTNLNQYMVRSITPTELNNSLTGQLINNRYSITNTAYTDTNTAYHNPYFQLNVNLGVTIDITIRIGYPQMELGSFATSPIPTTATSSIPTTAPVDTRLADNADIPAANFATIVPDTSIGSFFVQGRGGLESTQNGFGRFIGFNSSASAIARENLNTRIGIWDATTSIQANNASANIVTNISKLAASFNGTNRNIALNGISATGTSGVNINTVFNRIVLGRNGNNSNYLNGVLSRAVYFPTQLSTGILQSLTQ